MKKIRNLLLIALLILAASCKQDDTPALKDGESNGYTYQYVEGDPLNVRIYTLKNGLKVYLSKYDAEPRIQTQIAVRAGGKNDPATNTGLAHYLEHIMFKGTGDFGTMDWASESVLLDSIENMFNHYATLTDSLERVAYYKLIDKVSNEAARFAIANEYDKMITGIGARGLNAYTTEDRTVYICDIPANQMESWVQIEANRFQRIVPRLFHTELEAVYEEKNRSLDNDYWKTFETMYASLFTRHPYGTQTVIGTIEHLKNPSITEIKKYFDAYYRPNNVAVCMSGDIDFDKTIALVDKHFGDWKPNENLPRWTRTEEEPITSPVVREVYGPDAEWINIGFRFNGRNTEDYNLLRMTDMILSNSMAGLIDINLKQQQKVLEPSAYVDFMNDYCIHTFSAKPREGQTLEQVRDLLLEQIELLKKGEFEDWLVQAVATDLKKNQLRSYERNWARSSEMVIAFTNDIPWSRYINELNTLKKYTKKDIVDFANKHYGNNYVAVLKRTGKDPNARKVAKPEITKVAINKEAKSAFHQKLAENKVEKLKPVFVDYDADVKKLRMKSDVEVLYTPNTENELFSLYYLAENGTNNDPRLKVAVEYLQYIGTSDMTAEDIKKELYKLGSSFGVSAAEDQTYIYLSGLSENMDRSIQIFEKLLADPQPDKEALGKLVDGIFKNREDTKKDKQAILFSGLLNYSLYGPNSPFTNVLSNKALRELTPDALTSMIKGFTRTEHRVLYYGPKKEDEVLASLNQYHVLPEKLDPLPAPVRFEMSNASSPMAYWTHYDMVQAEAVHTMKGGKFDKALMPYSRIYNEYMGYQTFQELREAQGLAYSVFTSYGNADAADKNDTFFGYIGTQVDKQEESMAALKDIILNMPVSEDGFRASKEAVINQLESERVRKEAILFSYLTAKRRGLDYDIRKDVYEKTQGMTLDDVKKFQEQQIRNATFNTIMVANRDRINLKNLEKYGKVRELTLDEIFGYEKKSDINLESPGAKLISK